jgi:hypothetical protein
MIGVEEFVTQEDKNALHGKTASVDEISVEQIWICFRGFAIQLKDVHQIVVLPMNISTNGEFVLIWYLHDNDIINVHIYQEFFIYLFTVMLTRVGWDMKYILVSSKIWKAYRRCSNFCAL